MDFSSKKFSIHFKNPRKKVGQEENRLEIFGSTRGTRGRRWRKNEILTQRDDEDDEDDDDGSV